MVAMVTTPDAHAREWAISDDVVRLREWGSDRIHELVPASANGEIVIGSSDECALRLVDASGRTSRRHARLVREQGSWTMRDAGSTNGIRVDGARRDAFELVPGLEIGIGGLTLIAESSRLIALRAYCARVLGWAHDRTEIVDHALRAIRAAASRRSELVLCGGPDLVAIGHALHRIALGAERPFVACDPRRRETEESVRAVRNVAGGLAAFAQATGGTLCVWSRRLPRDFDQVCSALRNPDARVQLVVCATRPEQAGAFVAAPVVIPSLASRRDELPRIVEEYAQDALAELDAPREAWTAADREWIVEHAASSLAGIEKAALRLIALRTCGNVHRAAARLGMAHVSLARWIGRRKLPMRLD